MINRNSLKLTRATIDRLPSPDPSGRQRLVFDAELKGFGVLISGTTTAKSFVVQSDVTGKTRRITVGRTNVLSLDEGCRKAIALLAQLAGGIDPKEEKRREQANAITLSEALENYLATRKVLKPSTVRDYRANVDRYLADWKDRPLRLITREMVAARHALIATQISQRSNPRERRVSDGRGGPGSSFVSAAGSSSANGAMRVLRLLFNHAVAVNSVLGSNPVGRLSATKAWFKEERRTDLVRAHELPAWYRAVAGLPNPVQSDYLKLLLFTGLRRNEAACLTWDQVDLRARLLTIAENKASRTLQLPLSDYLLELLVARRAIGLAAP